MIINMSMADLSEGEGALYQVRARARKARTCRDAEPNHAARFVPDSAGAGGVEHDTEGWEASRRSMIEMGRAFQERRRFVGRRSVVAVRPVVGSASERLRNRAGGNPKARLNARLKDDSDSYPT